MKASSLDLLEKTQLPPAQARAILLAMEAEFTERDSALAVKIDLLATRSELQNGLRDVEHRLELKIESLRGELRGEIGEIKGEIRGVESRLIRWNFLFWVTQLAAVAALLKLVR